MLQKFIRIYNIVISVLLVVLAIGAVIFFNGSTPLKGWYCVFFAVIVLLMGWVTNTFTKRMIKQQSKKR